MGQSEVDANRELAFMKAAATVKCLPFKVEDVQQVCYHFLIVYVIVQVWQFFSSSYKTDNRRNFGKAVFRRKSFNS